MAYPASFGYPDGDQLKIVSANFSGENDWQSMDSMFEGASNLDSVSGKPDLTDVTDMSDMFYRADNFNSDIGDWNVSSVDNMWAMFNDADSFNGDLSSWCVPEIDEKPNNFDRNVGLESGMMPDWECLDVVGLNRSAKDPDGDGLYEDVRGSGRFSILDVQALFNALKEGDPVVSNHTEKFDFKDDGEIHILDVQALFKELGEPET
jgi:surface protein